MKQKHVHLIGICGTAMASLAGMLKQRGFHVTGSDQNVYEPMASFLAGKKIAVMNSLKRLTMTAMRNLLASSEP